MMKKFWIRVLIGICFIPFLLVWLFLFSLYVLFLVLMFIVKGKVEMEKIGYLILIEGVLMLLDWGIEVMVEKGVMKKCG